MKKLLILVMLLSACLLANAWANDEGNGKRVADSLKKAGDAAGGLLERGGKAVAPEVHKAGLWLGGAFQSGGKKSDKAGK
jgi:hypothetical protein